MVVGLVAEALAGGRAGGGRPPTALDSPAACWLNTMPSDDEPAVKSATKPFPGSAKVVVHARTSKALVAAPPTGLPAANPQMSNTTGHQSGGTNEVRNVT